MTYSFVNAGLTRLAPRGSEGVNLRQDLRACPCVLHVRGPQLRPWSLPLPMLLILAMALLSLGGAAAQDGLVMPAIDVGSAEASRGKLRGGARAFYTAIHLPLPTHFELTFRRYRLCRLIRSLWLPPGVATYGAAETDAGAVDSGVSGIDSEEEKTGVTREALRVPTSPPEWLVAGGDATVVGAPMGVGASAIPTPPLADEPAVSSPPTPAPVPPPRSSRSPLRNLDALPPSVLDPAASPLAPIVAAQEVLQDAQQLLLLQEQRKLQLPLLPVLVQHPPSDASLASSLSVLGSNGAMPLLPVGDDQSQYLTGPAVVPLAVGLGAESTSAYADPARVAAPLVDPPSSAPGPHVFEAPSRAGLRDAIRSGDVDGGSDGAVDGGALHAYDDGSVFADEVDRGGVPPLDGTSSAGTSVGGATAEAAAARAAAAGVTPPFSVAAALTAASSSLPPSTPSLPPPPVAAGGTGATLPTLPGASSLALSSSSSATSVAVGGASTIAVDYDDDDNDDSVGGGGSSSPAARGVRFNYASMEAGGVVLAADPEAKGVANLLVEDKDR